MHILFNRILRATLSFWRLRVEAEIRKKKISRIYNQDKDCKFWAGVLLRNVVYLLSLKAPGYRLAITHSWCSPNSGNSRAFTVDIDFFIDFLISESTDKACPWKLAMLFLRNVIFIFELDLCRWPWPWYQQMHVDEICLHTKFEPCK